MSEEEKKEVSKEENETINEEDLNSIIEAKKKTEAAVTAANEATSAARIADLEYRILVQHIFLKYNMKMTDRIDDSTGTIFRQEDAKVEEEGKDKE